MNEEDIIGLAQSKKEEEFVRKALAEEIDVSTNIVEVMSDFPYIGAVLKLGAIPNKILELRFVKKIARFLQADINIPEEEKEAFLRRLSRSDRRKIQDYITQYLFRVEDDEKADLMGYIYAACVRGKIDTYTLLRLCSIVDRAFLYDLRLLPRYVEKSKDDSIAANNFINLGLIDNYVGGIWKDGPTFQLNSTGLKLYEILSDNHWF